MGRQGQGGSPGHFLTLDNIIYNLLWAKREKEGGYYSTECSINPIIHSVSRKASSELIIRSEMKIWPRVGDGGPVSNFKMSCKYQQNIQLPSSHYALQYPMLLKFVELHTKPGKIWRLNKKYHYQVQLCISGF